MGPTNQDKTSTEGNKQAGSDPVAVNMNNVHSSS